MSKPPPLPVLPDDVIGMGAKREQLLTVRVDADLASRIEAIAKGAEITVSSLLYELLKATTTKQWQACAETAQSANSPQANLAKLKNHERTLRHRLKKVQQAIEQANQAQKTKPKGAPD